MPCLFFMYLFIPNGDTQLMESSKRMCENIKVNLANTNHLIMKQ
jgi:hypothetical protein